jgi:hypothetical protein
MTMTPGHFRLYTHVEPALTAGDYRFTTQQNLDAAEGPNGPLKASGLPISPLETHVRVTSPRYVLPPDQVLSTYPPAGTQGSFGARLPQVVIKRRTLPWERDVKGAPAGTPWLALVVFAEGEATFLPSVPVAQCVSAGRKLSGVADVQNGSCLEIRSSRAAAIMPTRKDVPLLAHAREVDINDTELMMGDDDGFLAVVIANRLPLSARTPDGTDELPVVYHACLINLEEQFDLLIPQAPAHKTLTDHFVLEVKTEMYGPAVFDHMAMNTYGAGPLVNPVGPALQQGMAPGVKGLALGGTPAMYTALESHGGVAPYSGSGQWSALGVEGSAVAVSGMSQAILGEVFDPTFRFPVLLHWTFTSYGDDTFESYMKNVDNGLIGTLGEHPKPVGGRPPLEVVETGHVGLDQRTRRGDSVRAWYRGPLLPHPADLTSPRLQLAHAADQLRAVIPDGREDLSLAAAFEIGRLLALSQPSLINALLRWRQSGYQLAHAEAVWSSFLSEFSLAGNAFDLTVELGAELARGVVSVVTASPLETVGPPHVLHTAGTAMEFEGDPLEVVTQGFALESVSGQSLNVVLGTLQRTEVPVVELKAGGLTLANALGDVRANLVANVLADVAALQVKDAKPKKGRSRR